MCAAATEATVRRRSAVAASQTKKFPSRISATLIASAIPASRSRGARVSKSSKSFSTAQGGAKVPTKFFTPLRFTAFLTPTPLSFCDNTVEGARMWRTPRCAVAAASPTASRTAPPPPALPQ